MIGREQMSGDDFTGSLSSQGTRGLKTCARERKRLAPYLIRLLTRSGLSMYMIGYPMLYRNARGYSLRLQVPSDESREVQMSIGTTTPRFGPEPRSG